MTAPTYASHPKYSRTIGKRYADFSEMFLTASRGFKKGKPLVFEKWQLEIFEAMFEVNDQGYWRHRTALIGIPRKNGKSMLTAVVVLYALLFGGEGVQIYSAAKNREQAKIVFLEVGNQVRRNPWLQKHLKVTRDQITNPSTGGVYKALAAEAGAAQGLGPLIVVADELGEWEGEKAMEMWGALTEGSGDRPESLVIGISTAGYNPESLLGGLYKHGRRVSLPKDDENYLDDESFFFRWWEAPQGCDVFDEKNWAIANPNLETGLLDINDLKRAIANPTPYNIVKFQRYRLNQWVRIAGVEFVSHEVWDKAATKERIPLGADICIGFDGSLTGDSTGLVMIDVKTGIIEVLGLWENKNNEHGWYVDRDEVFNTLKKATQDFNVKLIWADPSYFQMDLLKWARELKVQVNKIPANQMGKWAQRFTSALTYGESFQTEDENLTRHVFNAVLREDGSFEKTVRNSKEKIDLLVCATLANGAREFLLGRHQTKIIPAKIGDWDDDDDDDNPF